MELNDVTSYLGLKATTIEDFKKEFSEKYKTEQQIMETPELLSKFTGRITSQIHDNLITVARAQGIEFTRKEIEDMKIEGVFNHLIEKHAATSSEKIKELEELASKNNDGKIKEWEDKYKKVEGSFKDYKDMVSKQAQEWEAKLKDAETRVKGATLKSEVKNLWSKAKYAVEVDELKKKGHVASFNEKYNYDLDENENLIITDKSGKQIPNPNKHGVSLSPEEVLELDMNENKLTSKNPDAGKVYGSFTPPAPKTDMGQFTQPQSNATRSRIDPRLANLTK